MRAVEIPYSEYLKRYVPDARFVRELGGYQILSSSVEGRFRLLAVGAPEQHVIVCEYRNAFERQHDIELLKRVPDGATASAIRHSISGVWLGPPDAPSPPDSPLPPPVPSANALPRPEA